MRVLMLSTALVGVPFLLVGCSQSNNDMPASGTTTVTPVAFNPENAPTVEFNVPDMMCPEGCGEATRQILADQDGAIDVQIDFPAKTAVVAVDRESFDAGKALDELIDHGFENSSVKKRADQ